MADEVMEKTESEAVSASSSAANSETPAADGLLTAEAAEGGKAAGTPDAEQKEAASDAAQDKEKAGEEKNAVPEKYDFRLPDGVKLLPGEYENFSGVAREMGLDNDKAQKLMDFALKSREEAQAQFAQQRAGWVEELQQDAAFGGGNFEANVRLAQQGLARFDTDGSVKKLLRETGYDNHPALVRLFAHVGKALGEDTVAGRSGDGENKSLADRLYGDWDTK